MTATPRPGTARPTRATVLLNARGAQTRNAVGFKLTLPGEEFLFGELVATYDFLDSDRAAAYGGHCRSLATDHPSLGVGGMAHRRCSQQRQLDYAIHLALPGRSRPQQQRSLAAILLTDRVRAAWPWSAARPSAEMMPWIYVIGQRVISLLRMNALLRLRTRLGA